jgi:hypothetical protein
MLVTKSKFKTDDIVSIKLTTGEEVVGKYISEDDNSIDLDKPYRLMQYNDGFAFVPMMVTTDPDLPHTLFKPAVIVITATFQEVKDQYFARLATIPKKEVSETKPAGPTGPFVPSATKTKTTKSKK